MKKGVEQAIGRHRTAGFGILLLAAIFLLDLRLPLGVAGGVPYVAPVLLGLWQPGKRYALFAATAASVLTVLGYYLSPPGGVPWVVLTNRALALFGIWVAAGVVLWYKRLQGALDIEQAREQLLQNLHDTVFLTLDQQGRITLINEAGCELLGLGQEEILGEDWSARFVPERLRPEVRRVFDTLMAGQGEAVSVYENPVLIANGQERVLLWHNQVLRDSSGQVIGALSAGQDLTRQRQTEAELAASLHELAELKFALDEAAIVARTDASGIINYVNEKFCEISQYSRRELLGQDHRIVNSGYHPKEFMRDLWETILSGKVWRGEICNRAKDGSRYWVDTTIVPFLDAEGAPYQFLAIRSDVTAQKAAQKKLREKETLAQLGEMAAVVAHEVKNPLAGMSGALQIIRGRLPEGAAERQVISDILARIDVLARTIQDLLFYARPRELRLGPVELMPLLEKTAHLVAQDPRYGGMRVELNGPAGATCLADAEYLAEALLNLVLNATQAMAGKGVVRVSMSAKRGGWEVAVADTGPGIPPEVRERVFEPFFTTKGHGTGLGLSLAKRVAESQGGSIALDCPGEGGTRVSLWLPAHGGAPQK